MAKRIDARTLHARLEGPEETALIDVREQAPYAASHPILAANIPLSRLELLAGERIPRRSTPIVVEDAGEGIAEAAAAKLEAFGYTDVSILDGGTPAWSAAGLELFSGMHVPSKAFGEFVEHAYGTPSVSAEELKGIMDSGRKLVVLDSRPMDEYRVMNIPTGVDVPGAELVYRVGEVAPEPDTLVVVNCAGRTRSIIGAQSLINAGIPNEVVALRNGTMGWHLAGYQLEHGNARTAPEPAGEALAAARARSAAAAARFGVRTVDAATLDSWRAEADRRTLAILDVRTIEEFEAGRIADSRHAPGGQLVQATDLYLPVRNARVVLVDDKRVRADMTGSWLAQLGWKDVYVLESGLEGQEIASGRYVSPALGLESLPACASIAPAEAKRRMDAGSAVLLDLARSLDYRDRHPEGAWWACRTAIAGNLSKIPDGAALVLTAPEASLARLTAADLADCGREVLLLDGGSAAWEAAGLPLQSGMTAVLSEPQDTYLRPYDRTNRAEIEKAMNDYLTWEIALVEQIKKAGGLSFRHYPA
ncbi:thiosulfate sulfurtransferase [Thalassobaculum fulvum]|uniref:Thiosulfate sulfurtransferase n=1 Tax=Thalassobaculum fulvum TaxID=1633335 RepID=A0A918XQY4_9PROT|nr:rhodanese-like domain-containing protein [Thalassobaculum fulvum]GHD48403.1 thiosulfate sulfurtransferase [Thalassobaculum fulvum]